MVKSAAASATPVPLNAALCVPTLSTTESEADALPADVGLNVTVMVQELPAASDSLQVFVPKVNADALVPPMLTEVMGSEAVPAFLSVKVCEALVLPTFTLPKDPVVGVSAACGAAADVPVPVRVALWVPTLSTIESVADASAAADGVKITVRVQLAPAASDSLQVLVAMVNAAALVPLIPAEVMGSAAFPLLVRVKVCAGLVEPTVMLPKLAVAGVSAAWAVEAAGVVPLRVTVWGEPEALSATETVALASPATVGAKVTERVQLAPASNVELQLFVWVNSLALVPVMLMPVMLSVALPGLDRVIVCAVLVVATVTLVKDKLPGLSEP